MLEKTEALTKESGPDTNEVQTVHNIYLLIDATNMIAEGGETIAECWNISKRGRNIMSIIFSHGRKRIHRHEPAVNVLKQQQQTKRPIPSLEGATSNLTTIHITTANEGAFGLTELCYHVIGLRSHPHCRLQPSAWFLRITSWEDAADKRETRRSNSMNGHWSFVRRLFYGQMHHYFERSDGNEAIMEWLHVEAIDLGIFVCEGVWEYVL